MVEAVVIDWNDRLQTGKAKTSEGQSYQLDYCNGQSFCIDDEHQQMPMLTGRHEQPVGYQLKVPQIGDPILVSVSPDGKTASHWGYMRHYIDIVERRYGTAFVHGIE